MTKCPVCGKMTIKHDDSVGRKRCFSKGCYCVIGNGSYSILRLSADGTTLHRIQKMPASADHTMKIIKIGGDKVTKEDVAKMDQIKCPDCEVTGLHPMYDAAHGIPRAFMKGTDRYECGDCGKQIYREEGLKLGFLYPMSD